MGIESKIGDPMSRREFSCIVTDFGTPTVSLCVLDCEIVEVDEA